VLSMLRLELQKNVVMCQSIFSLFWLHKHTLMIAPTDTMYIVITTIALKLELTATPAMAVRCSLWEIQALRTAGAMVSALYCFELIYRFEMRLPLCAHVHCLHMYDD